ncbi:MAG: hypothetical protein NUV49_00160 [Patescibacteria group bacterium]|nr:hypothetical protein [Patescibacteria group bacterium]
MMDRKIPMSNGDEFDAFTNWRKVLKWRSGERASVKRGYRRRVRRGERRDIETRLDENR